MYTLAYAYRRAPLTPATLASQLYRPSYLSGLWALAYYDMIPERVVWLTSVTPRVPRHFENPVGVFDCRNIRRDVFFGYLAIKLEIDTSPPSGAHCERRIVSRYVTFFLQHYDLPSMLAGKLHAAITRRDAKGRDWYDLMWYLSQRPPAKPNVPMLQNALDQTQGVGNCDARLWQVLVWDRLESTDMEAIWDDVHPFLERPEDAARALPPGHSLPPLRANAEHFPRGQFSC